MITRATTPITGPRPRPRLNAMPLLNGQVELQRPHHVGGATGSSAVTAHHLVS